MHCIKLWSDNYVGFVGQIWDSPLCALSNTTTTTITNDYDDDEIVKYKLFSYI